MLSRNRSRNQAIVNEKPAAGVLYPDFEDRILPSGKRRDADVKLSKDKEWVLSNGGTSLFDKPNVFRGKKWLSFKLPEGTEIPESIKIRFTGYNPVFEANHYQIESVARCMRIDSFKGALDNLARNAIVRSIEMLK